MGADAPADTGSIPAPAGEPSHALSLAKTAPVYPRACGGTFLEQAATKREVGLSPRLRGNRTACQPAGNILRSIPAPAGEPNRLTLSRLSVRVYPRACGGTWYGTWFEPKMRGLSPRLRGTAVSCQTTISASGLSPRLRGNQVDGNEHKSAAGSIPAPAGEPTNGKRPP